MPLEPGFRSPLRLIPGRPPLPVLTPSILFRPFIDGSLSLVSPDLTYGIKSRLFRDAHHHRSLRQQLAVVWSPLLITGAEGPALISHPAPHLHCCWCARGTQWSRYFDTSRCASAAGVARPRGIRPRSGLIPCQAVSRLGIAGAGACVIASQTVQAYFGRMCRITSK
jgi:hypothetical protein